MSIKLFTVLLLLWFSFQSCNSRSFGVTHSSKRMALKKNEKANKNRVSIQPDMKSQAIPNSSDEASQEHKFEKKMVMNSNGSNVDPQNHSLEDVKDHQQVKVSSTKVQSKGASSTTVSFRVPKKKKGESEVPGFNLDYLPPKTHPPAHN